MITYILFGGAPNVGISNFSHLMLKSTLLQPWEIPIDTPSPWNLRGESTPCFLVANWGPTGCVSTLDFDASPKLNLPANIFVKYLNYNNLANWLPGSHLSLVLPPKQGLFQSKQWTFGFQVCIPGTQEAPPFHWPKSLPDWMIPDWKGVICGDRNMGCGGNHQFPATSHVPSGKQTGDVKPSRKPTYAILGSFYQNHRLKHTLECDILIPRRIIPNTIISAKNSTRNDVPRCSRWHRFSMCVCVCACNQTNKNQLETIV